MIKAPDTFLAEFFRKESAGGIVLIFATVLAMILANTPFQTYYNFLIDTPVAVRIGGLEIAKPLLLWINDGLMAVFFLLVGLELKRELLEGHLSSRRQVILPAIGAVGGMAIPALIYVFFNAGDSVALQGWAIPAATDIAFALGILALVAPHAFGAPQPDAVGGAVPPEIAGHFAAASLVVSAIFWAMLGWFSGSIHARLAAREG